jgi:hypothetical protein
MFRIFSRFCSAWRKSAPSAGRKRRIVGEVLALEQRQLMYYSATLMANPQILFPPTGRGVTVTISGTFTELNHPVKPTDPIPQAAYTVVDDYRQIQPKGAIQLTYVSGNTYSFSFPLKLQAKRASDIPGGRHYYVTVAALDSFGWSGAIDNPVQPTKKGLPKATLPASLAVWVPHDRSQIPPHLKPSTHHATAPTHHSSGK